MIKKILVFAFVLIALIAGCENDDSPITGTSNSSNHSPNAPSNPVPADNATNVTSGFITLFWQCSDPDAGDTLRYDVYYGELNPINVLASNILTTSADLGIVPPHTSIAWKVVAKDNHGGVTNGPVWKFTTGN
jgi:hypothetical protein